MTRYGYLSESIEDEQVRLSNEDAEAYCDAIEMGRQQLGSYQSLAVRNHDLSNCELRQRPLNPREFGPMCSCCAKRGLIRLRPHEYRCPRTKLEMRFYVRDGGYLPVPLKTAQTMDALGISAL